MTTLRRVSGILAAAALCLAGGLFCPAQALLADHDCAFCHILHGAPGFDLLNQVTVEAVCLSCHAVSINDTAAAAVHNPAGVASDQPGYITCRECHDHHDNYINANGNPNIMLIGIRKDPVTGEQFNAAVIREELPTGFGPYREVIFEDLSDFNIDGNYPGPGVCQICHDPHHNLGATCIDCHAGGDTQHDHVLGFQ